MNNNTNPSVTMQELEMLLAQDVKNQLFKEIEKVFFNYHSDLIDREQVKIDLALIQTKFGYLPTMDERIEINNDAITKSKKQYKYNYLCNIDELIINEQFCIYNNSRIPKTNIHIEYNDVYITN